jgi:predicted  nucleic acid-binding Zn-ribbon protein
MATAKEYSVEEKLAALLNLQKVESKLDAIAILKGELPIEVRDLEDEIQGLHSRETRIEEEINGINEFIEQKKQTITQSQELIKKYEKQSDNVKNNREYEAINKELEMQTLEVKLAERHIKDANEEIADKARALDIVKKNIANKDANLKVKKSELDKIIAETEKEEKEFSALSEKARASVDPRLLSSFDRIRKNFRNGLAVVPVVRDACGGCFNAIPPQRQSEIRQHKKIIVCENCGRVLVEEEMNTEK